MVIGKYALGLFFLVLMACQSKKEGNSLFEEIPASISGVDFANNLNYTEQINPYTYKSFFNGGGIGIGDINNDGFQDLFFTGNRVSNKLYLNKGNFEFEDITETAGLATNEVWSTGVSMVDVNQDGFLDIYVCKSGPPQGNERYNALYINNGDLTFSEQAEKYGLNNKGLSVHAAFFDYDRDGDLDCYLLNNSIRSVGGYDLRDQQRTVDDSLGGNKFFRNDNGFFVDISHEVGIYTSEIGFGLGVMVSDVNMDNWPDIYVSNDFFERDYLYINNQDGTFTENLESYVKELSMGSMGADMADINNDGLTEIFVTEMLPERHDRLMSKTVFESWDKYQLAVKQGYYHQFSRNVLQLNNGNNSFSEISRISGTEATDWSWGALIFDMDNDGWKDIFVANGIYKDLLDQDYINFMATPDAVREMIQKEGKAIENLVDMMPTEPVYNYYFGNNKDLTFANKSREWSSAGPGFSNGSAYSDLDNDGDLDLVLNNLNSPAQILRNTTVENKAANYLAVVLQWDRPNIHAIGSKVKLQVGSETLYQELSPMRGFQSSVDYRLYFGLDSAKIIDQLEVIWPDGSVQSLSNVQINQQLLIKKESSSQQIYDENNTSTEAHFSDVSDLLRDSFSHQENTYVDFDRYRLLTHMRSGEGPCLCKADINDDGLEDFYIGGAKDQAGRLYLQEPNGQFSLFKAFEDEAASEDVHCVFFDANGDQSPDLYVTSGGIEFSKVSTALRDRLYFNQKDGFQLGEQVLTGSFESTSVAVPFDIDQDGDLDLFVGGRLNANRFGLVPNSYVLENNGQGHFEAITAEIAPSISQLGMVTDAVSADFNKDGVDDLLVVGEWMGIKLFINQEGKLIDQSTAFGFDNTSGWYNAVEVADINGDSIPDVIAGNHGLNTRWEASLDQPLTLFVNDFDANGTIDHIPAMYFEDKLYPMVQLKELSMQLPSLKKEVLKFNSYKDKTVLELFGEQKIKESIRWEAETLETSLWLSGPNGFQKGDLPIQAQFSPVYAISTGDYTDDGTIDILLAGNLLKSKPEFGIYHANYGVLLKGDGKGHFEFINYPESGIFCEGEVRDLLPLRLASGDEVIAFARSNDKPYFVQKRNNRKNETQ